jgi:hypothetical protein
MGSNQNKCVDTGSFPDTLGPSRRRGKATVFWKNKSRGEWSCQTNSRGDSGPAGTRLEVTGSCQNVLPKQEQRSGSRYFILP